MVKVSATAMAIWVWPSLGLKWLLDLASGPKRPKTSLTAFDKGFVKAGPSWFVHRPSRQRRCPWQAALDAIALNLLSVLLRRLQFLQILFSLNTRSF